MSAPAAAQRPRALPGRRLLTAACVLVAAIWFLLDQATKIIAERALTDRSIDLGVLDLNLVYNPNGAFGLPGFAGMFVLVTIVVVVLVARSLRHTDRMSLAIAYGLVTGGALGNCLDRIVRTDGFLDGPVVDFLDFRWWPVFNLADVGIVTGAAAVAILVWISDREEAQRARRRTEERSVRPEIGTSKLTR